MKIALDAMGGDRAPAAEVEGSLMAVREFDVHVVLVGQEALIRGELARHGGPHPRITIVDAPSRVTMDDLPSQVVRRKRDSSIWIATELVKSGEVQAVISAGNTGATMATALFLLGTLEGVERPAIAAVLPTLQGTVMLLDVGANVDCKPAQLVQFAMMGAEYSRSVLNKPNPRVGLLSIGAEDSKGNDLTKEAFKMLKEAPLTFVGNVEGRDVYSGGADIIVCDGFIGNVALKISEGLADAIYRLLKREIAGSRFGRLGYFLLKEAFSRFRRRIDYAEHGGAPLLGVNGLTIICHGRSSPRAIKNAIRTARDYFDRGTTGHIREQLRGFKGGAGTATGETTGAVDT